VASHEGKEYKIGQASFFTENGEPVKQSELISKKKKKHKK
jgi:hypothetical protein